LLAAAKAAVAVAMSTKSRESFWPQISAEGAREAARKARVINRRTAIARPSRRFHEPANINALGRSACAQPYASDAMFANLYRHAENPLFKCRSTGGKEIAF
jgi:hypothetical protein